MVRHMPQCAERQCEQDERQYNCVTWITSLTWDDSEAKACDGEGNHILIY